jgi:DHA1 family multidrug resistance protein-like MFS transporter
MLRELLFTDLHSHFRIIIKRLQYEVTHPQEEPHGWRDKLSPRRLIHNLAWMSAMVSRDQARQTFRRAFSRPPRLLFTNPVCALFALYYGYLYACIYIFLVTIPLLYTHQTQYPNLFSYEWPQYTAGLAYIGLGIGYLIASVTGSTQQDKIYRRLSARNKDNGQPEYRVSFESHDRITDDT